MEILKAVHCIHIFKAILATCQLKLQDKFLFHSLSYTPSTELAEINMVADRHSIIHTPRAGMRPN